MKKVLSILFIGIIITACHHSSTPTPSPSPTPTPTPTTTSPIISFVVAGTTYTSSPEGTLTGSSLEIQSNPFQTNQVALYFVGGIASTGTVSLNSNGYAEYSTFYTGGYTAISQYETNAMVTGVANITSLNQTTKLISGTFSFTAAQIYPSATTTTVSVTNGIFTNVTY